MYEVLMDDLKTTNSDIAICNHYDESKNKTLCKNVSDRVYTLKNQEIQELVIKDKIKSYIWQMLFKRELLNEPMPTSKNYEDYSILLTLVRKCQTGGLYLPAAVSLPAFFEKAASSTIYLSTDIMNSFRLKYQDIITTSALLSARLPKEW